MDLIFLWHFHQPYYGLPDSEVLELPWVRLHAAKSYLDMAAVLGAHPGIKVVANFSGGLLEQLERTVQGGWRDRFWDLTLRPAGELNPGEQRFLLTQFFSFDWPCTVARLPRLGELLALRGRSPQPSNWSPLSRAELTDLQVLFNLAWCGFTLRARDPRVRELMAKGRGYDEGDKALVLDAHADALARVLPAWRALAASGQVEVSASPLYHPILPLLIDSDSGRRALPDHPMPARFVYPEDAAVQVARGLDAAEAAFGTRPAGMWPSEGSVSPETLPILGQAGVRWAASDEQVLLQSARPGPLERRQIYEPWRAGELALFFRDHELSDLVGFSYAKTDSDRAVADFAARLSAIRGAVGDEACVSVILDGENAWEHYPDDGYPFLDGLYRRLSGLAGVRLSTPQERLAERPPARAIQRLHSGSWISANFRIWIGTPAKNHGWDQLQRARRFLADQQQQGGHVDPQSVERALRFVLRAEASDWMWWAGDDFSSPGDAIFDRLFRENLKAVYNEFGRRHPDDLDEAAAIAVTKPLIRPPRSLIHPRIDGRNGTFLDWVEAGHYLPTGAAGAMAQTARYVKQLHFGYDLEQVYLKLETARTIWPSPEGHFVYRLELALPRSAAHWAVDLPLDRSGRLEPRAAGAQPSEPPAEHPIGAAFFVNCLEVAIPFAALGAQPGDRVEVSILLERDGVGLERVPQGSPLELVVPDATFEGQNWQV